MDRVGAVVLPTRCWCGGGIYTTRHTDETLAVWCGDSRFHDPTADGRPQHLRKLYIAGPMSRHPDCNYPAFHRAADELARAGFTPVNPADSSLTRAHYVDFLRDDLRKMLDCDGVATLEGWWESVGARNEVTVAGLLRMPVRSVEDWISFGPSGSTP